MNKKVREEITDSVGQLLESFIIFFVNSVDFERSFGVASRIGIADEVYAYNFSLHKKGSEGYEEIVQAEKEVKENA